MSDNATSYSDETIARFQADLGTVIDFIHAIGAIGRYGWVNEDVRAWYGKQCRLSDYEE